MEPGDPLPDSWRASLAASLVVATEIRLLREQLRGSAITPEAAASDILASVRRLMEDHSLPQLLASAAVSPPHDALTRPLEPGNRGDLVDGRYRLLQLLGEGGMGQVYLAEQLGTGRRAVLKFMHASARSAESQAFFEHEIRALAAVQHPRVASIYDAGRVDGRLYIAMEYVSGESLRAHIESGDLSFQDACLVILQACAGLDAIHTHQIIHRDIKPENIMIRRTPSGIEVKIVDFGIAIINQRDAVGNLTGEGMVSGTCAYMSPEQVQALPVTPASDVYSLGIVAYELFSGANPFRGRSPHETMFNQMQLDPPPLDGVLPHCPAVVARAVERTLVKDPARRARSARDLAAAMAEALSGLSRDTAVGAGNLT